MEPDFRTEWDRWQRVHESKRSREAVPSEAPALWRFFRNEVLVLALAPVVLLWGILYPWLEHSEQSVFYRVLYTLATAVLAVAFVALSVAAVIYGI